MHKYRTDSDNALNYKIKEKKLTIKCQGHYYLIQFLNYICQKS